MRGTMIVLSLVAIGLTSLVTSKASADLTSAFGNEIGYRRALAASQQEAYAQVTDLKLKAAATANSHLVCETVSDCTNLPMGARACGGPTSFLITSIANPQMTELREQIKLATEAEDDANRKYGAASICSIEMPPSMGCVSNVCVEVRANFAP